MICIICGTNRRDAATEVFAQHYYNKMKTQAGEVLYLSLAEVPVATFNHDMYREAGMPEELKELQDKYIYPASKFLFVLPEYNGTFPGVFKLFIDAISVRSNSKNFKGKKVALAGISDGRAGNLRGMDQVSDFMNYLGAVIMPNRLPFSQVGKLIEDKTITDPNTLHLIENHIVELLNF